MEERDKRPNKDFFSLDKYKLDEEWEEQPRLYFQHALMLADARYKWELAKSNRAVVAAEIDVDIRRDPSKYGMKTASPKEAVENIVLLQKQYREADSNVIKAKHEVDIIQAAVEALEHRKKALEKEVDLFLSNYWSEPRGSKSARQYGEDLEKKDVRSRGKKTDDS